MTDELVKRLRSANDESFVETLCGEAADRIDALTAERDRLRLYAGHDDDCTVNRYPSAGACSCGLRAAFPAVQPDPVPNSRRSPMEHERDLGDEG